MDSDAMDFDLERDHLVTAQDVLVLRDLRRRLPSWFSLTPAQLEAMVPNGALERRATTPAAMPPFTLR
jgi:hypothetical protein